MVRLHWHVEDGFSAYISVGGMKLDKATGVYHAACDVELAGQSALIQGLFTLPANYNTDGTISTVGVILAHGNQADTYKGKLLTHLAVSLAQAGHMVVRYYCAGKEQRRLRLLEKVLDAAATSPFARTITRWVMGGIGSGARVCTSVGCRCREQVAGYLLMSYPLLEPVSVFKGPAAPDSTGPLLKCTAPVLILQPADHALGPVDQIVQLAPKMPTWDVRLVAIKDVDGYFRPPDSHASPREEVRQQLSALALQFVDALTNGTLDDCDAVLPRIKDQSMPLPPPPPPPNIIRPPLQLAPFHLLIQQHMRLQAGNQHSIQNLPPAAVSLLLMSQQLIQQQQQLLDEAVAKAAAAAAGGPSGGAQGAAAQGAAPSMITVLPAGALQPRLSMQTQDAPVVAQQAGGASGEQPAPDMTLDLSGGGQAPAQPTAEEEEEPDAKRQCVGVHCEASEAMTASSSAPRGNQVDALARAVLPVATTVAGLALLTRPALNLLYEWIAKSRPGERSGTAFLTGGYAPVEKEVFSHELEVEGAVPEGLEGVYMRTGPNPYFKPVAGYHWFDGDGMIHAVKFKGGKAMSYANHYVRTEKLKLEQAKGKAVCRRTGDLYGVRGVVLALLDTLRVKLGAINVKNGLGVANTAMVYHAKRILSLHEGDLPYQLRMLCNGIVETVGRLTLKDKDGNRYPGNFTAHPKVDHKTGDMFFFGYRMDNKRLVAGMMDGKGQMYKQWAVDLAYPAMMHDCAMTANYAVLLHLPLVADPEKFIKQNALPIAFNPALPARIGLIRRDAPGCTHPDVSKPEAPTVEVQWFDIPPCYVFHVANSWEDEGGKVHIVACRFERFNFHGLNNKTETAPPPEEEQQELWEFVLDPATGKAETRKLSTLLGVDFPVVNTSMSCYPTRYTWAAQFKFEPQTVDATGIAKFDVTRGPGEDALVGQIQYPPGCYGGEAVFTPRPAATSEDDGWLLVFVTNTDTGSSAMHVYDAKTMDPTPLAKITMPQRVPFGFHGTFVPQDCLDLHAKSFA